MTNAKAKVQKKGGLGPIWRGFRPAVPATVGAFALTLLFAAMMPMPWIASLSWNLYLDTIHPIFVPPLGNAARIGIALAFALIAALIALVAALALVKPAVKGNRAMNQRVAARARQTADADSDGEVADADAPIRRRRVDMHPDDAMVAPIRAERDLPAGGLGPIRSGDADATAPDGDDAPFELGEELLLDSADEAPSFGNGDASAPFSAASDPAPMSAPMPTPTVDPADNSLNAMVARFESGLGRRRDGAGPVAANPFAPAPANEDAKVDDPQSVDLALEAALSTLQRMSKSAVG
jgi:hypothetical protein